LDKETPVHSREISIHISTIDDDTMLAEGTLRDNRKLPSYSTAGRRFIEPGDIHHIVVRLYVSVAENVVVRAEADMVKVPGGETCHAIKDSVKNLIGISVLRGFAKKVLEIMGGVKGCLHMTNLVIAMGSAIVQAEYYRVEESSHDMEAPEINTSLLKNSCWLWREDGPQMENVRKAEKGNDIQ